MPAARLLVHQHVRGAGQEFSLRKGLRRRAGLGRPQLRDRPGAAHVPQLPGHSEPAHVLCRAHRDQAAVSLRVTAEPGLRQDLIAGRVMHSGRVTSCRTPPEVVTTGTKLAPASVFWTVAVDVVHSMACMRTTSAGNWTAMGLCAATTTTGSHYHPSPASKSAAHTDPKKLLACPAAALWSLSRRHLQGPAGPQATQLLARTETRTLRTVFPHSPDLRDRLPARLEKIS